MVQSAKRASRSGLLLAVLLPLTLTNQGVAQDETPAVIVPNVVGVSGQKARTILLDAGLVPKFQFGDPAPSLEKQYQVIRQNPAADDFVAKGAPVKLTIYAKYDPSAKKTTSATSTATTDAARNPAAQRLGIVIDHEFQARGTIHAIDLRHGHGQQRVSVQRDWVGGNHVGMFGPGWADAAQLQLLQRNDQTIDLVSGGEVLTSAYRDGQLFKISETATIQSTNNGSTLTTDGMSFDFDTNGQLAQIRMSGGHVTRFVYDGNQRLVQINNGPNNTLHYHYNADGRVVQVTGPENLQVDYSYDQDGRLAAVTNAWRNRIAYEYDSSGGLQAARDTYGNLTPIALASTPDPILPEPDTTTDTTPDTDTNTDDTAQDLTEPNRLTRLPFTDLALPPAPIVERDEHGNIVQRTKRNRTSTWSYDDQGRVTSETGPTGEAAWTYDPFGRVATVKHTSGETWTYQYNQLDQVTRVESSNGTWSAFEYDEHGSLKSHNTSSGFWERREYDQAGRLQRVSYAPDQSESYEYDADDRIQRIRFTPGPDVVYSYDEQGRRVAETWSTGQKIEREYDTAGRLLRIKRNGLEITRKYDEQGGLATIVDPLRGTRNFERDQQAENILAVTWDGHGRWSQKSNVWAQPLAAVFEHARTRREIRYSYNETGDLEVVRTPGGRYWGYRYDKAGRLLGIDFPGGQSTELTRDTQGRIVRVTRDGVLNRDLVYGPTGRLRMESSALGIAAAYSYDAAGRIQQVVEPAGPVSFRRDESGQLIEIEAPNYRITQEHHPDGTLARRNYVTAGLDLHTPIDESARPAGLRLNGINVEYVYAPAGHLEYVILPGEHTIKLIRDEAGRAVRYEYSNGLMVSQAYDHLDRVTSLRADDAASERVFEETYEFDVTGNVVRLKPHDRSEQQLSYDEDDRLRGSFSQDGILSFDYDENDNLQSVRSNAGSADWQLDDQGRPVSLGVRSSYEWDRAGNLTTLNDVNARVENAFDAAGRLTSRQVDQFAWQFGYLPDGDRHWSEGPDGKRWYAYLPSGLVAFKDEAETAWLIVSDPQTGLPLALCGTNGTVYFAIADRLGSLRRLLDPDGNTVASCDYGVFGTVEANEGQAPLAMYAGMVRDSHGLYYARRRYYDPALFRFISVDPLTGVAGYPATHNAYAYAANNPLRFIDPHGMQGGEPRGRLTDPKDFTDTGFWSEERLRYEMDRGLQQAYEADDQLEAAYAAAQPERGPAVSLPREVEIYHQQNAQRGMERYSDARNALQERGLIEPPNLSGRRPYILNPGEPNESYNPGGAGDPNNIRKRRNQLGSHGLPSTSGTGTQVTPPQPGSHRSPQNAGTMATPPQSAGSIAPRSSGTQATPPSPGGGTAVSRPQPVPTDQAWEHGDPGGAGSPEAKNRGNRLRRYQMDRNGKLTPMENVDGVDVRPPRGGANFDVDNDGNLIPGSVEYPDEVTADRNLNRAQRNRARQQVQNRIDRAVRNIGPRQAAATAADSTAAGASANRTTRPFTSRRPWRGPRASSPVANGGWRRFLPAVGRGVGRGLAIAGVLDFGLTAIGAWLDDQVDRSILDQETDSRRRREEIIKRWVQTAQDARDRRADPDRERDFVPNLDGSIPSDDELEQRIRRNVFNGLNPFTGILMPKGQATQRGDANKFRRDMDQANRLLNEIETNRRNIRSINRNLNQLGLDLEKDILEAEQNSGIDPADFEQLKKETAELNRLIKAYQEDSTTPLPDAFEAAADKICQAASNITRETSPEEIQSQLDAADRDLNKLDQRVGPRPNADTRLSDIRSLGNKVRSRAHELGRFLEWGDKGPDGDGRTLDTLEDRLNQVTQLMDQRQMLEQNVQAASTEFGSLVSPWMSEPEARNLWNRFANPENDAADQQTGEATQSPQMSFDDMHRRVAQMKKSLSEMPKDAAATLQAAREAAVKADEVESADRPGNYLEDKLRVDQARTRLIDCRRQITEKRDNPTSVFQDKFRALNPTRRIQPHPSEKPLVPLVAAREIFVQLPPPKSAPMVVVPNVVGQPQSTALTILRKSGLSPRLASRRKASSGEKPFSVYEQKPPAGSNVPKGTPVAVSVLDPARQSPTVASKTPMKKDPQPPKEDPPPKKTHPLDGTYRVQGIYSRVATRIKWKQVDANTAQVTFSLDGQEPKVMRRFQAIPAEATVTAKKQGDKYVVTNTGSLKSVLTSGVVITPKGTKTLNLQIQQSNGIATNSTAVK